MSDASQLVGDYTNPILKPQAAFTKPRKKVLERDAKENFRIPANNDSRLTVDPNYKGKHLQLQFTVEDEGVFTMPWSATITYGRPLGEWPETVCAENTQWYSGKNAAVPTADKPDF